MTRIASDPKGVNRSGVEDPQGKVIFGYCTAYRVVRSRMYPYSSDALRSVERRVGTYLVYRHYLRVP